MKKARAVCAGILALPLMVFGGNYFVKLFALPEGDGSAGANMLQAMRDGGLMSPIALSHVVVAVLLLWPKTRFLGALLQLPMSLGIAAFHATMLPEGLPLALIMLALNAVVLFDPERLKRVMH